MVREGKARDAAAGDGAALTVSRPELLEKGSDEAFRRLLYDLFAFGSRLEEARQRFAHHIGLSPSQYMILIVLRHADPDDETGISQIAARLHLSGAFVTIEVNKLVRLGFVEKHPHSEDGRRVRLTITEAARARLGRLAAIQRPVNDALFASLDRDDFRRLSAMMSGLVGGSEQAVQIADDLAAAAAG